MTEKQYSKKRLLNKITDQIPGTADYSVKEVKVTIDSASNRFNLVLIKMVNWIERVYLFIKQTNTNNRKTSLTNFCTNYKSILPYYSNKENASLLADNVFFNFLIIQQTVAK